MASSHQPMSDMSMDEQTRQKPASYVISPDNRSFIRNRHFTVYQPRSQRLPAQEGTQAQEEPEEYFQDDAGNPISPLSQAEAQHFFESQDGSDSSEAIISNSNVRSDSKLQSKPSPTTNPTIQHVPQHHLIIAISPSFESDSSNFSPSDGNDSLPSKAQQEVRRTPLSILKNSSDNNRRVGIPSARDDYLVKLQSEISLLHRDVLGMKESIDTLTTNLEKQKAARIRNYMVSKYGRHNTDSSSSADSSSLSGLENIDALMDECLNSVSEASERSTSQAAGVRNHMVSKYGSHNAISGSADDSSSLAGPESNDALIDECLNSFSEASVRSSTAHAQDMKSLDQRVMQQNERNQRRHRQRQREDQSQSPSITPTNAPSRREEIMSPWESIRTPTSLVWDGDQHVQRNLFWAGHIPCVKAKLRGGKDMTKDDRQKQIFLLLVVCLASIAVLMIMTDAKSQTSIGQVPHSRRPRRSSKFSKKLTIDEQSNSCHSLQETTKDGCTRHCNTNKPQIAQELLLWKSYREGKHSLDPWKAIVLSLRERNSNPSAENYSPLVSEFTFWL
ncbi:unnamed protein product [Cylindrotheca closterium]|uniref:Uncharacterized protein n=1 Tax=Cylindrotheca closterium TaxID=2856 RepID=A0AAD2JML5_9STRA|nr:unnamed protein product [Cylindrotheca closterium]